jgi:glycosyltransferase involved in cell wall biosynthesis
VSVITTVKNGDKFIERLIVNLKLQTLQNFELIVVDDGSTDNTLSLLTQVLKTESVSFNCITIKTEGVGRAAALDLGVKNSQADYIAILDVDDAWHPQKLEKQLSCIDKPGLDLIATKSVLFQDDSELTFEQVSEEYVLKDITIQMMLMKNHICHSSVLIKRDICKYNLKQKSQIDYELWLSLLRDGYKIAALEDELTFHRIHEDQSFESKMGKAYIFRAKKLVLKCAIKSRNYKYIPYILIKSILSFILSRGIRQKLLKVISRW